MGEHCYLPGDGKVIWGQPLGLGQHPKSVLWQQKTAFFHLSSFSPSSRGMTSSPPDTPSLLPPLSFPGHSCTLISCWWGKEKWELWLSYEEGSFHRTQSFPLSTEEKHIWHWIILWPFLRSWVIFASIAPVKPSWLIKFIKYNPGRNDFQRAEL